MKEYSIKDAFKALEIINESESFEINDVLKGDNSEEFDELINQDFDDQDLLKIVDIDASDDSEIKDPKEYINKIILMCSTCKNKLYKDEEELVQDEEDPNLYNVSDECPVCASMDGYYVIGKVAPFGEDDDEEEDAEENEDIKDDDAGIDDDELEVIDDAEEKDTDDKDANDEENKKIHESLLQDLMDEKERFIKNYGKDTYDRYVKYADEHPEVYDNLYGNENIKKFFDQDDVWEDDEVRTCPNCGKRLTDGGYCPTCDDGEEDFDESYFESLVDKYSHAIYENADSYKVSKISKDSRDNLLIEGTLKFKSGKEKAANFMLENKGTSKKGFTKYVGLCETFTDNKKAFTLKCKVNNGKVVCESLAYKYEVKTLNESKEEENRLIEGRVFNYIREDVDKKDCKDCDDRKPMKEPKPRDKKDLEPMREPKDKELKEALSSGVSFKKEDLDKIKEKINSFEFKELVELDEKPNKNGICHVWVDTRGLGSDEEKKVKEFIDSIAGLYKKSEELEESKDGMIPISSNDLSTVNYDKDKQLFIVGSKNKGDIAFIPLKDVNGYAVTKDGKFEAIINGFKFNRDVQQKANNYFKAKNEKEDDRIVDKINKLINNYLIKHKEDPNIKDVYNKIEKEAHDLGAAVEYNRSKK